MDDILDYSYMKKYLKSYVKMAINKALFEYSVGQYEIAYQLLDYEKGLNYIAEMEDGKADDMKTFADHRNSIYKRLKSILARVATEELEKNLSVDKLFLCDKFYDEYSFEIQLSAYLTIALYMNSREGFEYYSTHIITPKFYGDKSAGVTFTEGILLTILAISTRKKALETLNTPRTTEDSKKRAKKWLDKNGEILFSKEFNYSLANTFLDLLHKLIATDRNNMAHDFEMEYWFDEKYKDRKDKSRFKEKKKFKISNDTDEETAKNFFIKRSKILTCDAIMNRIIPYSIEYYAAWMSDSESEFDCDKTLCKEEKEMAVWLGEVIAAFLDVERTAVCKLLENFEEAKEAGTPLIEYFNNL